MYTALNFLAAFRFCLIRIEWRYFKNQYVIGLEKFLPRLTFYPIGQEVGNCLHTSPDWPVSASVFLR